MPLPAAKATTVAPVGGEAELAAGRCHVDGVALGEGVVHDVRHDAVGHPLHRDLQGLSPSAGADDIE